MSAAPGRSQASAHPSLPSEGTPVNGEPVAPPSEEAPKPPAPQARNPLHGLTLEAIVTALADHYGWEELGQRIPVRCFNVDPSVGSSLRFLRKTPWAREKVEGLYLFMLREERRANSAQPPHRGHR
jgi:hypothetical protein